MTPTIQLTSGSYFNFRDPLSSRFTINDIAHSLSHQCRFTGHTDVFYSVAQHCVLVSHLVPEEDALAGLLHDAHEAFVGDVAAPLKLLLPCYRLIEREAQEAVLARFDIYGLPDTVKHADIVALATEKRDLMPETTEPWDCDGVKPAEYVIMTLPPVHAKQQFLARYRELTGEWPAMMTGERPT